MFKRIMVPVDLAHRDTLDRALTCATDLAKMYEATVIYVAVGTATPGSVAHNPAEFEQKVTAFAEQQSAMTGVPSEGVAMISHDPSADLDPTLMKGIEQTGADLVVMASHIPNLTDYIWPSNGGTIASHAKISVMVVR